MTRIGRSCVFATLGWGNERLIAPRSGRWRATYGSALEGHRQSFGNQDFANVPAIRLQRSATSPVIAGWRSFRTWRTSARHELKIEIASLDKITNSSGGHSSKLTLRFASSASGFGRIEAYQPNVGFLLENADRITVNHANVFGVDGACPGAVRQKERNCKGERQDGALAHSCTPGLKQHSEAETTAPVLRPAHVRSGM
jgi:hypothetical protein